MTVTPVYTAVGSATGGRDGRAKTRDGSFEVKLAVPVEMGGDGKGVAWLISATTLGAVLSMWLWLSALAAG